MGSLIYVSTIYVYLYKDIYWDIYNILLECNCHNKTKDCYYDENVAAQKTSLNTAGEFRGGGVCINCLQNTMGINCEKCIDGYYRPHKVRGFLLHSWASLSSQGTEIAAPSMNFSIRDSFPFEISHSYS